MSLPSFSTFFPSVARWINIRWRQEYRLIVDNETAVPIGIVNQNGTGAQGIWALTPISLAQVASPTAEMLADLAATYQVNEAPYARYRSDGVQLVSLDGEGGEVIPYPEVWFSPVVLTAQNTPLSIQAGLRIVE